MNCHGGTHSMRYGFIGLGNLGEPLAASLVFAGFKLTVHDQNRLAANRLIGLGAVWAESAEGLAGECEAVITCLPSPKTSELVLGQILKTIRSGSTWIEMSTLGRDEIMRLATVAAEQGVKTMELPVTGG